MEENSKTDKKPRTKKKTVVTFSGNESHAKVISPLTQDGNPVLRLMATGPRSLAEGSLDFADLKNNGVYKDLEKQILSIRSSHMEKTGGDIHIITGMQRGFDEFTARIAMDHKIPYTAVVPTKTFGSHYWKGDGLQSEFKKLLGGATNVIYGEDVFGAPKGSARGPQYELGGKNIHANMARNTLMMEMADEAIAFDSDTGGTADAIKKIKAAGKKIHYVESKTGLSLAGSDEIMNSNPGQLLDYLDNAGKPIVGAEVVGNNSGLLDDIATTLSDEILASNPSNSIAQVSSQVIDDVITPLTTDTSTKGVSEVLQTVGKKTNTFIDDLSSGILHSKKLKFGALGAAAIGGLGLVNKKRANKQFENLQKQRQSNIIQSGKSSMNTFSGNINSGYQSINVLKNKKKS
jgi:hypothetical protein